MTSKESSALILKNLRLKLNPRRKIIPARIRAALPGNCRSYGPPRHDEFIAQYIQHKSIDWSCIHSGGTVVIPPILNSDGHIIEFADDPSVAPDAGLLHLKNALVFGFHGWVVTSDDYFLHDTNHLDWEPSHSPVFTFFKRTKHIKLDGKTLNLLSWCASFNFYHWLIDAMPRLALFHGAGHAFSDVNHILMPSNTQQSVKTLIHSFGIPENKILYPGVFDVIECKELLATSHPGPPRAAPKWAVDFLGNVIGRGNNKKRRLFIVRGPGRRLLINEEAVWQFLRKLGFEKFDYREAPDELTPFREAELIVGAHGAGLSRIIFCPPGATLIELASERWLKPYFKNIAHAAQLNYHVRIGKCSMRGSEIEADFTIDIDSLRQLIVGL